jgi:hypothetical protein
MHTILDVATRLATALDDAGHADEAAHVAEAASSVGVMVEVLLHLREAMIITRPAWQGEIDRPLQVEVLAALADAKALAIEL